jgi:hypothetical protein
MLLEISRIMFARAIWGCTSVAQRSAAQLAFRSRLTAIVDKDTLWLTLSRRDDHSFIALAPSSFSHFNFWPLSLFLQVLTLRTELTRSSSLY